MCKLSTAHRVADADQGAWHLRTEGIDHVEEIAGVIKPCRYLESVQV
jgi:hypothetical protein